MLDYTGKENKNLHSAKSVKNDEFYTQLCDIELELSHYKNHFRGKVVYCNCDDPNVSNFFRYFVSQFSNLGLKKLIVSCYKNCSMDLFTMQEDVGRAVYVIYTGDEIDVKYLKGDGDFRSQECIGLLKQADIVVTNPPFSLFREYVAQLTEYDKKFLIIGNMNAVSYKSIFPLIKDNKLWLGANKIKEFIKPDNTIQNFGNICWFTNLDYPKRHKDLILFNRYNSYDYPKYDNFDAINVDKISDIPFDYSNYIGVPITFLEKYNPEQFEVIGTDRMLTYKSIGKVSSFFINGNELFSRIVIKNKNPHNENS